MNNKSIMPTLDLARKLIAEQFPEYASLTIVDVEKQGHDNRTYRLGEHMLIRMPTAADYALNTDFHRPFKSTNLPLTKFEHTLIF